MGVVLSPATRNKVIQAWVEHDLSRFANTVVFNFSVVCGILVVLVTSLLWLLRSLGWSKNVSAGKPTGMHWEQPGFKREGFYSANTQFYR